MKMTKQISLNNLVSGRIMDETWRDMTAEEKQDAADHFQKFMVESCRKSKLQRELNTMDFAKITENYGIYNRLVYYPETGETEYIAGQDYRAETQTIKKLLVK